ncbi:MAG: hypothetical protein K2Z81_18275 [Cyanobacteria bacterium]|nr:hypothetical protein [Cyanobacteriota bacterium]
MHRFQRADRSVYAKFKLTLSDKEILDSIKSARSAISLYQLALGLRDNIVNLDDASICNGSNDDLSFSEAIDIDVFDCIFRFRLGPRTSMILEISGQTGSRRDS